MGGSRGEGQYHAAEPSMAQPKLHMLFEDRAVIGRISASAMNEAEAALSGRIGRGQKLVDLLLGVFDKIAVQVQLSLNGKIALVQALSEALIHVLRDPLHILIGKLQGKDAAAFHEIPQFIQAGFVVRGQP
jgi:hypothetical protein